MPDNQGFEEAALQRISQQLDPLAEATASTMGMPPGAKKYSKQEQMDMWNFSPIADTNQRVQAMLMLKQLGKTDEEITDTLYPDRRGLITTSRPGVKDQIAFSDEMDREMAKQMAAAGFSMPIEQPMTAPSPAAMPEAAPTMTDAPMSGVVPASEAATAPSMLDQPVSGWIGG